MRKGDSLVRIQSETGNGIGSCNRKETVAKEMYVYICISEHEPSEKEERRRRVEKGQRNVLGEEDVKVSNKRGRVKQGV